MAEYREALREVNKMAGGQLLVQLTTESCGIYDVRQQMAAVRSLRVDGASFAVREFFAGDVDRHIEQFFEFQPDARQPRESTTGPLGAEVQQQVDIAFRPRGSLRDRPEQSRIACTVLGEHIADRPAMLAQAIQRPAAVCAGHPAYVTAGLGRSERATGDTYRIWRRFHPKAP